MPDYQEERWQQGVDSKALLVVVLQKLPMLLIVAIVGAIVASGIHLFAVFVASRNVMYVSETEYYIEFAEGRYEAKDYYNDFTWNDVIATDLILGVMMEHLENNEVRKEVKNMITADILSDVRYLTITIRDQDPQRVERVEAAFQTSLEAFGTQKKEFDSIYKIEDSGIVQEHIPFFAWRAAALGAVLASGIILFRILFRFGIGSSFYTKTQITTVLGVPVYGMTFVGDTDGKLASFVTRQEEQLRNNIKALCEHYESLCVMDACGGQEAEAFLRRMHADKDEELSRIEVYDNRSQAAIVVVIPFGVSYREKIMSEIYDAKLQGATIVGAFLINVDGTWARLYY